MHLSILGGLGGDKGLMKPRLALDTLELLILPLPLWNTGITDLVYLVLDMEASKELHAKCVTAPVPYSCRSNGPY